MRFAKLLVWFFALAILSLGGFFLYKYQDAHYISQQVSANGWTATVRSDETSFDFTSMEFYKLYTYEDHAGYRYEYRVRKHTETDERYILSLLYDGTISTPADPLYHPYAFSPHP
jgi:hypothetical protein